MAESTDDPIERAKDSAAEPTAEVGGEGGSPGDVEIRPDDGPASGSEAGETSRPTDRGKRTIVRYFFFR